MDEMPAIIGFMQNGRLFNRNRLYAFAVKKKFVIGYLMLILAFIINCLIIV